MTNIFPVEDAGDDGKPIMQRVDSGHRSFNPYALDNAVTWCAKTGDHMWTMNAMYLLSAKVLELVDTEPPILDIENLLYTGIGCYICEESYQPKLRLRRCPGPPKDPHANWSPNLPGYNSPRT